MQLKLEKLDPEQFLQLKKALLSGFPDPAKLKQMVFFGFEKQNLDEIATGNYDDVVFELIKWAETNGKLENLLIAARDKDRGGNPGNPQLKKICEQLGQEQATTKQSHRLLNPCNFDLNALIDECWKKLDSEQGVVGLAVSSDYDVFVKNFCERLKDELEIKYPYIPSLSLNPISTKPIDAVRKINKHKKNLQYHDVIYRIQSQIFEQDSKILDQFWQGLSAEFNEKFPHRLIIIIWGSKGCIFPKDVKHQLETPQFKNFHVKQWVRDLMRESDLGWKKQVQTEWQEKMIAASCQGASDSNTEGELLDIESVYSLIEFIGELLQQKPPPEVFLDKLEQRIQEAYV